MIFYKSVSQAYFTFISTFLSSRWLCGVLSRKSQELAIHARFLKLPFVKNSIPYAHG